MVGLYQKNMNELTTGMQSASPLSCMGCIFLRHLFSYCKIICKYRTEIVGIWSKSSFSPTQATSPLDVSLSFANETFPCIRVTSLLEYFPTSVCLGVAFWIGVQSGSCVMQVLLRMILRPSIISKLKSVVLKNVFWIVPCSFFSVMWISEFRMLI